MFGIHIAIARIQAELKKAEIDAESEKQWREHFEACSPKLQDLMLEIREKQKQERIIERRHQEQMAAQREIADAIRWASSKRHSSWF